MMPRRTLVIEKGARPALKHLQSCCLVWTAVFALHGVPGFAQTQETVKARSRHAAAEREGQRATEFRRVSADAPQSTPNPMQDGNLSGLHDFDFLIGRWQVHHRRLKERLANSHEWVEFEGTLSTRQLMDGWANMGDNVFKMPGGEVRGVSLRSYDPRTGQWAVWWLDGGNPSGNLDPPIKGKFENGVGTFYADDTLRGKTIRVRVTWSHITASSARWEQAFSPDGGKTWETNWVTEFRRIS
jgi:hypothetical protein